MIDGNTRIVGLFGYPVSHTASPRMHNAAFKALGLNYVYIPFEVKPSRLEKAVKALPYLGIKGVNLTIPHKVKVLPYLDWVSTDASIAGAVNTVVVKGNKLYGYNTDIQGFAEDFKSRSKVGIRRQEVFLLGAGGAGRAVAVALAREGAAKINISNRTPSRAYALLKTIKARFPYVDVEYVPFQDLSRAVTRSRIIINATSLGMKKSDILPIKSKWLDKKKVLYDVVYTSSSTRFLQIGRRCGAQTFGGIGMLARQGAISFYLWTGRYAPLGIMLKTLRC